MSAARERGWRSLFAGLTEAQRRDVREILAEDYAGEIRLARQLAEHARRLGRYPDQRARLLEIAAREEEHARWLRAALERLGGQPPSRVPSPPDARTNCATSTWTTRRTCCARSSSPTPGARST
jgi:rubrerythrin